MNLLTFDLIEFRALKTAKEWKRRYSGQVRCSVEWGSIPNAGHVDFLQADPVRDVLWLPWYTKGSWRTGIPRRVKWTRKVMALTRLPAVRIMGNQFLLLDGCHRMTELDPAIVLLDAYCPTKEGRRVFTDLLNWNWTK